MGTVLHRSRGSITVFDRKASNRRRLSSPKGRGWLRPAVWLASAALLLNLLVPLAVVAEAAPAGSDYVCHAAPAGLPQGPASDGASHHCPLCLALAGSCAAPPSLAAPAVLAPPSVLVQPHRTAPTLPPASVRLILPPSRAPPAA